ncbi:MULTISPECIES: glycosyl transferase [Falsihalocynthiibacter]|uniref:glycosyl transferase n=1 Tax=Falsihalocynthiibacter TaxID=2854182 RepID=UPI0030022D0E
MKIESENKQVAILMATYEPCETLVEQVVSFQEQVAEDLSLIVSDDSEGEPSAFLRLTLERFSKGPVTLASGPREGFAQNFLSLIRLAGPDVAYACLSDQDDVWFPAKIERSRNMLEIEPADIPTIYCSRTLRCDNELKSLRLSRMPARTLGFPHALVQNVAAGNTIMMNRAALDLLQDASLEAGAIVAHDWWIYQMITGVGGKVIFDQEPSLYYRQHGGNLIGANVGTAALLTRTRMVANGRFSEWNDINIAALRRSAHRFTPENQRRLALFARARRRRGIARLNDLQKVGVYRQTKFSNAAMWSAIALGKI